MVAVFACAVILLTKALTSHGDQDTTPMKLHAMLPWCLLFFGTTGLANRNPPVWMSEGPTLTTSTAAFELPIEVVATKIYVAVEVNGKPRRFVFDSGSPSMIDAALAEAMGLEAFATNTGTDAHGKVVKTEVVQVDVSMGGVSINSVPMMAANFSGSVPARAFIGDGVLGSDLFPLGAWQLDLPASRLRFSTNVSQLPHIRKSKKLKLYQFGYPYMPILDVKFARKAHSKALFDTGSPTFFAISPPDLDGASRASGVGRTLAGFGSAGASLGGQAPASDLLRVELKNLSVDRLKLGRVVAERRDLSPDLIGARLLERYVITLDVRSGSAYFKQYAGEPLTTPSFGFSLAFDQQISVAAVWDDSPAEAAGLEPGLVLTSINGVDVEYSEEGVTRALSAMRGDIIDLAWQGGSAQLEKRVLIPFP